MRQFTIPTREDLYEYLLRLYFSANADHLASCIDRAYRDLNRTLHGFAKIPDGDELRARASIVVRSFLTGLSAVHEAGLDQKAFDAAHRTTCTNLRSTYYQAGFPKFEIGQAQKWINMSLKYVFTFEEERLPGYAGVFGLAHIPIDNVILAQLRTYKGPRLSTPWSRLSDYEEYMGIQRWVRSAFPGSAPLAVEFALWQESKVLGSQDEAMS